MSLILGIGVPVTIMAAGYFYERLCATRDRARFPPPGELIDIGGRRLHLLRRGSGTPSVVIENGSGASSHIWWHIQNEIAKNTAIYSYDRAGLGWSDPAPLPRSVGERAAELHQLLSLAKIPPPYVFVAYSHGGLIVRRYAQEHPDSVAGIVFIDSGHETVYAPPEVLARRTSLGFRIFGILAILGIARLFGMNMRRFTRTNEDDPFDDEQRSVHLELIPSAHSYFVGADENDSAARCTDALKDMTAPGSLGTRPIAVITHGIPFHGKSGVSEEKWLAAQRQLAALSANSTFVIAEQSGHAIPLEQPELIVASIRWVLTQLKPA